ncbi:ABC transporter family protein [Lyngbya aestuarii BL J]|uniref:ABC transporter family protein n=1 Tax=Lyngbya aestuarii BL J TaxID=1348334 RepID=U7QCV7_9CYAN|nr:peptidase domain-containing ABC transporter [Lyngbya aestuarii]ERT04546.1 ABC transporter family protein [Lyngbya aestuarii BL J]
MSQLNSQFRHSAQTTSRKRSASESISAFEQLLTFLNIESSLAVNLSQEAEVYSYELGDEIAIVANSLSPNVYNDQLNRSTNSVQGEHQEGIYLICQGQVRLLGSDPTKDRDVSVSRLEAGELFGGDRHLFTLEPLPYQAIAASPVLIAYLSVKTLQTWLERFPQWREELQTTTDKRQRLIFFKTQTELRRLTSSQLRELLPEISERQIQPQTPLKTATPASKGRYWLYQGEIEATESIPQQGESWGYPDTTPTAWVAKTPLIVYQLSAEDWQNISENSIKKTSKPSPRSPIPVPPQTQPSATPVPSPSPNLKLELPKPRKLKRGRGLWRRYPCVEQQSSSDCGAACLATIGQYWGKTWSLNRLRNLAGVGRSGASLKGLARAGESLGFQVRPVRASLSRLEDQKNPWIAHWQGDHYVVVCWVKRRKVLIADPAQGKRELSRQEFLAGWTGYALLVDPTERLEQVENEKRSLGRFMGVLWPYKTLGLQIILISILIQMFALVSPLITQIIMDRVVVNKSLTSLHVFALGALLFGVWSLGLSSIRQYLLSYLSNRLDLTLISGFIQHTLKLPLKFFESRRVGDIITRVQENQKIQRFLIGQILLAWLNFVTGFVYLGLMLYYNWQLTVLILGLIPPILLLTLGSTPFLRKVSRQVFNASADQNSTLVEMMTGVSTVKSVGAEQELRWRWEDRLTEQLNMRFKAQKLAINLGFVSGLINSIGGTAVLWFGAMLVIQDQLTIGQFMAFNMMQGRVISPVIALAGLWDELQEVLISVERLNDVFDTEPEESPQKPLLVLPPLQGQIKFDQVTFRYGEDEDNTLENLSFDIQPSQTLAIVGRSGSGKSTLVKLLQALYHPRSGRVWIDGHDLRHVSSQSLRTQMGVVPQECYLFSGTILENITIYRGEYTLEEVVEVAKLAEAHSFIQTLPLGYNTKVGERGSSLSGGQRQRIAIARALLGNPRLLVLDEATSSLDTESERRFQRNLEQMSRDRTTIIIAHRLSTVRNADQILVLDRGVLVEKGNHQQLMQTQGLYYHLAQQQLNL